MFDLLSSTFKIGGLRLIVTCKILITSFSACMGLVVSFGLFFLAVEAKVGHGESNSKVAKNHL